MRTPFSLRIELSQQKVTAGQPIRGQAVLILDDVYKSEWGLNKCSLTLTGIEKARFCEQKKEQPKKAKNKNLIKVDQTVHWAKFDVHDFQGHKTLNGG